jgi:hypothetical protein
MVEHSIHHWPLAVPTSARRLIPVLGLFAGLTLGRAQPVMAPDMAGLSAVAASKGIQIPNQLSMPSAARSVLAAAKEPANPPPFHLGPIEIRPQLMYRWSYGSGLQSRPGSQANTSIQEVSLGLSSQVIDGWTVAYSAIQSIYSDPQFSDSLNHSFQLNGGKEKQFSLGGWAMGFTQGFNSSFAPQIETGRQTKQQSVTSALTAAYPLNRVFSLALGVNQNLRFSKDQEGNAFEWSTMNWLNAQATTKVNAGIGFGLGTTDLERQPNNTYERLMVRAGWLISSKVGMDFSVGLESRDAGGGQGNSPGPLFNLGLSYKPFEQTSLQLSTSRSTEVSLFENRTSERTGWNLGLNQRFFGKLNFSATLGEQSTSYSLSTTSVTPTRDDKTQNFSLRLGLPFRRRGTIATSYTRMSNGTNVAGFGFSSNQFSLSIGYRY